MAQDETKLRHVGIIMDGNGRWAKARNLPRPAGHRRGANAVGEALNAARRHGVKYVTLYAFSSENWRRPEGEISTVFGLLDHYIDHKAKELIDQGARIRFLGERHRVSSGLLKKMDQVSALSRHNDDFHLCVAVDYGGRREVVSAVRKISALVAAGDLQISDIDEDLISANRYQPDVPDPELIIRTSGEQRLSNFLLWQAAYSEFVFVPTLWPDFSQDDFDQAVAQFVGRDRRFGGVSNLATSG
jgi:undecaprenyl diphosphate synthase